MNVMRQVRLYNADSPSDRRTRPVGTGSRFPLIFALARISQTRPAPIYATNIVAHINSSLSLSLE